jgi:hypothetical protein
MFRQSILTLEINRMDSFPHLGHGVTRSSDWTSSSNTPSSGHSKSNRIRGIFDTLLDSNFDHVTERNDFSEHLDVCLCETKVIR